MSSTLGNKQIFQDVSTLVVRLRHRLIVYSFGATGRAPRCCDVSAVSLLFYFGRKDVISSHFQL